MRGIKGGPRPDAEGFCARCGRRARAPHAYYQTWYDVYRRQRRAGLVCGHCDRELGTQHLSELGDVSPQEAKRLTAAMTREAQRGDA